MILQPMPELQHRYQISRAVLILGLRIADTAIGAKYILCRWNGRI